MRNEVEFFYFHPQFDGNSTPRVFGYARTGQDPVGRQWDRLLSLRYMVCKVKGWHWVWMPFRSACLRREDLSRPGAAQAYNLTWRQRCLGQKW